MNLKSKVFLTAVIIILIVHLSFDFMRVLRKNDWGKDDEIMKCRSHAMKINESISPGARLSYVFSNPSDFKELSTYYQLRYFLAPSFLVRNQDSDTVLIERKLFDSERFQDYSRFNKIAIDSSYYLLIK